MSSGRSPPSSLATGRNCVTKRERDKPGRGKHRSPPQPDWLFEKAIKPLQTEPAHYRWRIKLRIRRKLEHSTNAAVERVGVVLVQAHRELLLFGGTDT